MVFKYKKLYRITVFTLAFACLLSYVFFSAFFLFPDYKPASETLSAESHQDAPEENSVQPESTKPENSKPDDESEDHEIIETPPAAVPDHSETEPPQIPDEKDEEPKKQLEEKTQVDAAIYPRTASLGNWSHYNGFIFEDAGIYESVSGGGLAVGGSIAVHRNFTIGSTYTTRYDPAQHIGEYTNEGGYPALLIGGNAHFIDSAVDLLEVYGGPITASEETLNWNQNQPVGFVPKDNARYESLPQEELTAWFQEQYNMLLATSKLFLQGNNHSISLQELASGTYRDHGPAYFENQKFTVNGEIYKNALFITVQTGSDVHFGQWWPEHSVINLDVNWALEYDLVVFNFPDAQNITMNSSTFQIDNTSHWSTTVDAWVGAQGMKERLALAEKVVYNFPQAKNIEANQALIQGTIMAPQATFTGIGARDAGHIYGHIIVKNFTAQGNFTIHAFFLSHWVYDIAYDNIQNGGEEGLLRFRYYLYFRENPSPIRLAGGAFVIRDAKGHYFTENNTFTQDITQAAVYSAALHEDTAVSLPLGEYVLEKIRPPDGFILNTAMPEQPHTYYETKFTLAKEEPVAQVIRYAEPVFRDVTFKITDAETGQGIPDASFTILRQADEYEDTTIGSTYTSGSNGTFTSHNLPMGRYQLTWLDLPPEYQSADADYHFTVYWDGDKTALQVMDIEGNVFDATPAAPVEIAYAAGEPLHTLLLFKYAKDLYTPSALHPLAGGTFQLYCQNHDNPWTLVEENLLGEPLVIVTNTFGYYRLSHLKAGAYRLVETKAPAGYLPNNAFEDEFNKDIFPLGYCYSFVFGETRQHDTTYLENLPLTTDITIAAEGPFLDTVMPLAQSAFSLEHQLHDGATWEEVYYHIETDANGQCRLENLPTGIYRLTQKSAATGYKILPVPEILLTVSLDNNGGLSISAQYNGNPVTAASSPVAMEPAENMLKIQNDVKTKDYTVFVMDGNYTTSMDESGDIVYHVNYLEAAKFRLLRRATVRSGWEEYGPAFVSQWQYDEDGSPIVDSHGNPLTQANFPYGLMYGDYRLIQTGFPEGYTLHDQTEFTFADGTKGVQVNIFTVTEEMTVSGSTAHFTVLNYKQNETMPFIFYKVAAENTAQPLAKAEFTLYSCDLDHQHDPYPTEGSCWSKNTPVIAYSTLQGAVSFHQLTNRDYLLEETEAPPGYRIAKGTWLIHAIPLENSLDIAPLGGSPPAFITKDQENETITLLPNHTNLLLPFTGGKGLAYFYSGGVLCILTAVTILCRRQNRKD